MQVPSSKRSRLVSSRVFLPPFLPVESKRVRLLLHSLLFPSLTLSFSHSHFPLLLCLCLCLCPALRCVAPAAAVAVFAVSPKQQLPLSLSLSSFYIPLPLPLYSLCSSLPSLSLPFFSASLCWMDTDHHGQSSSPSSCGCARPSVAPPSTLAFLP